MKAARHVTVAVVALLLVLLSGCGIKRELEGLRVTYKPAGADILKKELMPLLLAHGFLSLDSKEGHTGDRAFVRRQPTAAPQLLAFFTHRETSDSFLIGKGSADFTPAEVAIIAECSAIVASHADVIISGTLSKAASTSAIRSKFYAKIKKG